MNEVVAKDRCCGCGACLSVCKHQAIKIQYDFEGFEYPIIDQNLCVDCGLCKQTCPVINYDETESLNYSDAQKGFVARNKDVKQRIRSSSGSIFPPIAEWIIDNGGIVIGAAFDDVFNVKNLIVDSKRELYRLQGSKYLQCQTDDKTFNIIRKELQNGRYVLYTGLACQVEGLKAYLRKEYDTLYTIDLICMGIPSSKVWQEYLKSFFPNETVKEVNFKEKSNGWNKFCVRIETDKRVFKEKGMENLYLQSMFRTYNMRPSCFNCQFKKTIRKSDFTIADAWGFEKLAAYLNDNKGLSVVIIHSKKGAEMWEKLKDKYESAIVEVDDIAVHNDNLVRCKESSPDRNLFYLSLYKNPQLAFQQYCTLKKPSLLIKVYYTIRRKFKNM